MPPACERLRMGETEINRIFGIDPTPLPGGTIKGTYDCAVMARAVMARGLIMALNPGEFAGMGLLMDSLWITYSVSRTVALARAKPSDSAYFANDDDYVNVQPSGHLQGENVITTAEDSYFGWNIHGSPSYNEWIDILCGGHSGANQLPAQFRRQ